MSARPAGRPAPAFTGEQRTAIAARSGSWLLAANAGSGKTAVMAERFVEAVLRDGVALNAILALTFTEKAAGELRDRIRGRFIHEGRGDLAREADQAWVGTIHGFCARVLRTHPLVAGLDPRFEVLDDAAARRLAQRAFATALEQWTAVHGAPAVDLAAAYGPGLHDLVKDVHGALRSRGQTIPRLPIPPAPEPPDLFALQDAWMEATKDLTKAHNRRPGTQLTKALQALVKCRHYLADLPERPQAGDFEAFRLPGGSAGALKGPPALAYVESWTKCRDALADAAGHAALGLLDDLVERYATLFRDARRQRSAVDFDDLELGVRDLFAADPEIRQRWSERFALIMVDEFQDTNRLQLEVLDALDRDNTFAVGDELQSIYRFRHADVELFRTLRTRLGPGRTLALTANFRSRRELLDVLDAAFAPVFFGSFQPLRSGRPEPDDAAADPFPADGRLFDPDLPLPATPKPPPVELIVAESEGWDDDPLPGIDAPLGRKAEARTVAQRVRDLVDSGRRAQDIVVLVRATASLRLFEQALEEAGIPTYVVGGRGYWSQEQVRDGLAYLATIANPLDEQALLGVLSSPFVGLDTDGLILASRAGREADGLWTALREAFVVHRANEPRWTTYLTTAQRDRLAAFTDFLDRERAAAERYSTASLLERAVTRTGYDVAVLSRPGGDRRLANLRKLMRLAGEYEAQEGRDLRGFLAFAAEQAEALREAREGEAPIESEALDAVRLMTIHRAKGLEFPVVCVADLGREGNFRRDRLLVGEDGEVGLRLVGPAGDRVDCFAYADLVATAQRAEDEEERRLFYVAMTRAEELLVLSGTTDTARWPAARPGGAPLHWIARAVLGGDAALPADPDHPRALVEREWEGRRARVALRYVHPAAPAAPTLAGAPGAARRAPGDGVGAVAVRTARVGVGTALPLAPTVGPSIHPGAPAPPPLAPRRLSYSALGDYSRCAYRFYLNRVLGLPRVRPPEGLDAAWWRVRDGALVPEPPPSALDPLQRGSLVHRLLEDVDLHDPRLPDAEAIAAAVEDQRLEEAPTQADLDDIAELLVAFIDSPLRGRLQRALDVRREAPFAFALGPAATDPLVSGVLDVVAREPDGTFLVVDYKTDRLEGETPEALVERAYTTQRTVYALAGLKSGAERVQVVYCFLERPADPVIATFVPADEPGLTEKVLQLAAGALAGRYPPTPTPYAELCATCPGREALCHHPESLTLRPAAEVFAPAPEARSTG